MSEPRKAKKLHEKDLAECGDIEFVLDRIDLYYGGYREEQSEIKAMIEAYANEKVKEVLKEIQEQAKDAPITKDWIGFNAYK